MYLRQEQIQTARLWQNISGGLLVHGYRPIIKLVELVIVDKNANNSTMDREKYWIDKMLLDGENLIQSHHIPIKRVGKIVCCTKKLQKILVNKTFINRLKRKYKTGDASRIAKLLGMSGEMVRLCINGQQNPMRLEIYNEISKFYKIKVA